MEEKIELFFSNEEKNLQARNEKIFAWFDDLKKRYPNVTAARICRSIQEQLKKDGISLSVEGIRGIIHRRTRTQIPIPKC